MGRRVTLTREEAEDWIFKGAWVLEDLDRKTVAQEWHDAVWWVSSKGSVEELHALVLERRWMARKCAPINNVMDLRARFMLYEILLAVEE